MAPTELPRAAFEPQMVRVPAGPFLMGSTDEQIQAAIADGLDEEAAAGEHPSIKSTCQNIRLANTQSRMPNTRLLCGKAGITPQRLG